MKTGTVFLWMAMFIVTATALMALGDWMSLHPQVGGVLATLIAFPLCLLLSWKVSKGYKGRRKKGLR